MSTLGDRRRRPAPRGFSDVGTASRPVTPALLHGRVGPSCPSYQLLTIKPRVKTASGWMQRLVGR